MKKSLFLLITCFMASVGWGKGTQSQARLNIRSADGTVSNYPFQLKVPNTSLTDNGDGTMTLAVTTGSVNTVAILNQATLQSGATFFVSSGTATSFSATTVTISTLTATNITGTTTNDNAPTGDFGEYLSSTTSNLSCAAANTYRDIASVSPTAGDWDISMIVEFTDNGATAFTPARYGIGTVAGNSSTGLAFGDTAGELAGPTTTNDITGVIPLVRKSISATTTYYLKIFCGNYLTAVPQASGRLSARRVR